MNLEWSCPKAEHCFILSASFVFSDQMGIELDIYVTSETKISIICCPCVCVKQFAFKYPWIKKKSIIVRDQNMVQHPFLAFPLQHWFRVNLPLLCLESLKIISLKLAVYSWEH